MVLEWCIDLYTSKYPKLAFQAVSESFPKLASVRPYLEVLFTFIVFPTGLSFTSVVSRLTEHLCLCLAVSEPQICCGVQRQAPGGHE